MSNTKPLHTRLLFIDRKIREGKYPSCMQLALEWEVSYKTMQRDIDYMRYQLNAPIEYSAKERGLFYSEDNFNLPAFSIKESDLFAIYLAENLLVQYEGTPLHDNLQSVYKKIEQSLSDTISIDADTIHSRVTVFPSACAVIDPVVWEAVFQCLRTLKRLKINYKTPGKFPQTREVDIFHAVRFEENWYVIGFCHLRKQIRTFHLSRMEKAKIMNVSYEIPEDFNFLKLTGSHFGLYWTGREETVKIKFSKPIAPYILEKTWHKSQHIEESSDGSIILTLTVNHLMELKNWVLSWGKNAQVLSPDNFVEQLKKDIGDMARLYE
jgi:proteasome accessory factor B